MIKEAAQRLLDKGQITQDEYETLEKSAVSLHNTFAISKVLNAIRKAAPNISADTARKAMSATGKAMLLAPFAAAFTKPVQNVVARAAERAVKGMPRLSKIMFPKPSMVERVLKGVRPAAIGVGTLGAAGLIGKEIGDQVAQDIDIKNTFKEMQQKVPQLQQYDQDSMKDYFDVVKIYSPKAASNPLVAGALVHKMMTIGGVDHKLVQDISQIERRPRSGIIFDIAASSARSLTGIPDLKGAGGGMGMDAA